MKKLDLFATEIRLKSSEMLLNMGYGHLGASFSIIETLAALYSGELMKFDPKNPKMEDRDWFVLSKGHGATSYYATLSLLGYFDDSILYTLNHNGTSLPSHPDRLKVVGVDATTGSLGQGVSQAVGIAKGLKIQNKNNRVFSIIGDGEANEGQVFEAAQFAVSKKLDNFVLYIDDNKKQLDGTTDEISIHYNFKNVFEALGFDAVDVDGADAHAILDATQNLLAKQNGKPKCIVLDTVKGQGIEYFAELKDNHHVRFTDSEKELLAEAIATMKEEINNGNA